MIDFYNLPKDIHSQVFIFACDNNIKRLDDLRLICKKFSENVTDCFATFPIIDLSTKYVSQRNLPVEHKMKLKEILRNRFRPTALSISVIEKDIMQIEALKERQRLFSYFLNGSCEFEEKQEIRSIKDQQEALYIKSRNLRTQLESLESQIESLSFPLQPEKITEIKTQQNDLLIEQEHLQTEQEELKMQLRALKANYFSEIRTSFETQVSILINKATLDEQNYEYYFDGDWTERLKLLVETEQYQLLALAFVFKINFDKDKLIQSILAKKNLLSKAERCHSFCLMLIHKLRLADLPNYFDFYPYSFFLFKNLKYSDFISHPHPNTSDSSRLLNGLVKDLAHAYTKISQEDIEDLAQTFDAAELTPYIRQELPSKEELKEFFVDLFHQFTINEMEHLPLFKLAVQESNHNKSFCDLIAEVFSNLQTEHTPSSSPSSGLSFYQRFLNKFKKEPNRKK